MEFQLSHFLSVAKQWSGNGNSASDQCVLTQLEKLQQYSCEAKRVSFLQSGDEVDFNECLSFLVKLICDRKCPDLIHQSVQILYNMCKSEEVRSLLYVTFNLSSSLAALVATPTTQGVDEEVLTARLRLLQRITYGHQVDYHQPDIDQLVLFLVQQVLTLKKSSNLAAPVLGTLANLCRNNRVVQKAIKTTFPDRLRRLLKNFSDYFESNNNTLVISSLSLYVMISTSEPKGEEARWFIEEGRVELVLQSVFNILLNNFKTSAWRHAADFLNDLLGMWEEGITSYRHLQQCLKQILNLLSVASKEQASEVFRLLLRLSSVSSICKKVATLLLAPLSDGQVTQTDLARAATHTPPPDSPALLSCVYWAAHAVQPGAQSANQSAKQFANSQAVGHVASGGSHVASLALEFLATVLEGASLLDCPVHMLMPGASVMLAKTVDLSNTTDNLIKFMTVLCDDPKSVECLDSTLTCAKLRHLIDHFLSVGGHNFFVTETGGDKRDKVYCVLLLLNLVSKIQKHVSGLSKLFVATLKESRVLEFLGRGLASASQSQVSMSLSLLMRTQDLPTMQLSSLIASLNHQKSEESDSCEPPFKQRCRVSVGKENKPVLQASHNSLHNLIAKMENLEPTSPPKSRELSAQPNSSLVQVLEHQISTHKVTEDELLKLVEAKTQALHQADCTISQLRAEIAGRNAEMKKLRGVVNQAEHRCDLMKKEVNQSLKNSESQHRQLDELTKEKDLVSKAAKDLEEKIKLKAKANLELQKETQILKESYAEVEAKVKQEKTQLFSQIADLKEDLAAASEENTKLTDQAQALKEKFKESIKTNKEEIQSMKNNLQNKQTDLTKLEEKNEKLVMEKDDLEKEKDDLEKYVDKLRTRVQGEEGTCKTLTTKVKMLEDAMANKDRELTEKKEKVTELEAEYEKFQSILSFINKKNAK